jgi:hypothetical protein
MTTLLTVELALIPARHPDRRFRAAGVVPPIVMLVCPPPYMATFSPKPWT